MTALTPPRSFASHVASGSAYDYGAHITGWHPTGQAPVLWMSAASNFEAGLPIRGGIPICFPWFGPGRTQDRTPIHGYGRLRTWQFVGGDTADDGTAATWELHPTPADVDQLHVVYRACFGSELRLSFTVTNTGSTSATFEAALHTYFAVSDIRQIQIEGLEGSQYLDRVAGDDAVQSGPITFSGETDRVYTSHGRVTLVDAGNQRRIVIERNGSANVVVWNPWIAKAAAMPDFGDDEWPGMVCIEAANALDDAVALAPGESHTMTCTVAVESL